MILVNLFHAQSKSRNRGHGKSREIPAGRMQVWWLRLGMFVFKAPFGPPTRFEVTPLTAHYGLSPGEKV